MRPFEVGDLVVFKNGDVGVLKSIDFKWRKDVGVVDIENPLLILSKNCTRHYAESDVKHIRTPRKDSAEARAIVAIAAAYYRAKLNKRLRACKVIYTRSIAFAYAKEYAQRSEIFELYEEQKAMLK